MIDHSERWTPAVGLRRLALSLAVRAAIGTLVWTGLVVLARTPSYELVSTGMSGLIVGLLCGAGLGAILSVRLTGQAGFVGPIVIGGAYVAAIVVGITGWSLAETLLDPETAVSLLTFPVGVIGGGVGAVFKFALVEE